MTHQQLHEFKKILETQQTAAAGALNQDRKYIVIEKSADLLDELSHVAARDLAVVGLNRYSSLLRLIRAALARIDEGEFGTCLECGEAIALKRLMAVPWAPLCIRCQEVADNDERREDFDPVEESDMRAA